jgi:hypothetical protein
MRAGDTVCSKLRAIPSTDSKSSKCHTAAWSHVYGFAFQESKERLNEICQTMIGGNTSVAEVTLLRRFR